MANSALAATLRIELTPKLISGLTYNVQLGRSFMTGSRKDRRARVVTCQVVGVSDRATTLGFSVPAAVAARWNEEFGRPAPVETAWVGSLSRSAWARWSPQRRLGRGGR